MHPLSALREVQSVFESRGEDFRLLDPVSESELKTLTDAGVHVPEPIRALLQLARGIDLGVRGEVRFFDAVGDSGHRDKFPESIVLGYDDCGNEALVDLAHSSESWGPVFFTSHDPPVVVLYFQELADFIAALASDGWGEERRTSPRSIEKAVDEIWDSDPFSVPASKLLNTPTDIPRQFIAPLLPKGRVTDLRERKIGTGFVQGRFRSNDPSLECRLGRDLVFGVSRPEFRWIPAFYSWITGKT